MIQPLHSFYFSERLAAETEGTIALPDEEPTYDAVVICGGPGRFQDDGTRQAMQAQAGDRIICLPKDWWEWQHCQRHIYSLMPAIVENQYRGFVHDRDLIAVIPGPDHTEIYPTNDYVLIEPDRLYVQDEGAVVQERPSGILVASHALVGSQDRAKQEGWLAYEESRRLWDSPTWQEEPEYYRHRRLHAYLDGLPADVRRWARHFAETEEAPAKRVGWVQREAPTRGRIYSVPDTVDAHAGAYWLIPGHYPAGIGEGDVVHWSRNHTGVLLQVGERQLLALKAEYLEAVETE